MFVFFLPILLHAQYRGPVCVSGMCPRGMCFRYVPEGYVLPVCVRGVCVSGMCFRYVCGEYVFPLCVRGGLCVSGMCPGVCVSGMCEGYVFPVCEGVCFSFNLKGSNIQPPPLSWTNSVLRIHSSFRLQESYVNKAEVCKNFC